MKDASDPFVIEVIDSLEGLDQIKKDYMGLFERSRAPSFFCSYHFVRTVWANFGGTSDRLFLLVIRKEQHLVGIAPFLIEPETLFCKVPFRMIKYVAEWGDGDKPGILTTEDDALIWSLIHRFLTRDFTDWDALALDEQPLDSPVLGQGLFDGSSYTVRCSSGIWSYRASIGAEWSDYVGALKGKVRGDWARCRRRLSEHAQPHSFECFESPDDIGGALDRYVALEQLTWKGRANFSIGGSRAQLGFYRDLVQQLAPEGMVAIYFLTSGHEDAAAALVFRGTGVVYGAHICHAPSLSKFSPGVVLNAEIMKRHFGSSYTFFDFLALQGGSTDSRFKESWATESRQLTEITIYKRGLRFLLYRIDRTLRKSRTRLREWRRGK